MWTKNLYVNKSHVEIDTADHFNGNSANYPEWRMNLRIIIQFIEFKL